MRISQLNSSISNGNISIYGCVKFDRLIQRNKKRISDLRITASPIASMGICGFESGNDVWSYFLYIPKAINIHSKDQEKDNPISTKLET